MALSGTWSFSVVRDDIIRESMLNVGAIGEAEVPTAQETTDCARKLNMLVKQWMGKQDFAPGLKMWTRQRGDLFLGNTQFQYGLGPSGDNFAAATTGISGNGQTYGQTQLTLSAAQGQTILTANAVTQMNVNDYVGIQINNNIFWSTIAAINPTALMFTTSTPIPGPANGNAYVWNYTTRGQRPLAIATCILRDINNNDTPLNMMTLEDYEILPSKTQTTFQSDPTAFYYESQFATGLSNQGPGQFYIDCGGAQDITKHLHIVYLRPVMDFNNPGDNPEYPQQWYRPLCWGLSREIAGMFDAVWTPEMNQNLMESLAMAHEADTETTSFYFQPYAGDPYSP